MDKNTKIKQSIKATHDKRKLQKCSVFKVKIDESSLSKLQKKQLKMLFVEAKWIVNDCIAWNRENIDNKIWEYVCPPTIKVKKLNEFENRELKYLGSQMKQSIVSDIISNIRTLSTLKKNGYKVGKLKFRSEVKCVNLKQYKSTYQFKSNNKMKIQNIHGLVRVNGLKQFINDNKIEFANAKILNTPKGYYISITTYKYKEDLPKITKNGKTIGIDFGCQTSFTTSEGEKINVCVRETERLKRLQRKLHKSQKGSNNRNRLRQLIGKEYQRISNVKLDKANKIVAKFKYYDNVVIQNEQLSEWSKTGHGKAIQHSILGLVKDKLKRMNNIHVLNKYVPTTKLCTNCGNYNDLTIYDRVFLCSKCGIKFDRDIHAAVNMVWFFDNKIGMDNTEFKRVEIEALIRNLCKKEF